METTEKTNLYPSQINTKTISCRISTKDYVVFLEDALSKGITLNDWLLMKIYSQSFGKVAEIEEKGGLNEVYEYMTNNYFSETTPQGIINLLKELKDAIQQEIFHKENLVLSLKLKEKSEPNLNDIKAQILTIASNKITHAKGLKSYMQDINNILSEIG